MEMTPVRVWAVQHACTRMDNLFPIPCPASRPPETPSPRPMSLHHAPPCNLGLHPPPHAAMQLCLHPSAHACMHAAHASSDWTHLPQLLPAWAGLDVLRHEQLLPANRWLPTVTNMGLLLRLPHRGLGAGPVPLAHTSAVSSPRPVPYGLSTGWTMGVAGSERGSCFRWSARGLRKGRIL